MASDNDQWVRIFDITDTSKHQKGFIVYKVISMLYPQKCPEAITRIVVWKRYNDFKKLYMEMKALNGKYNLLEKLPCFHRGKFFGKYDAMALLEKKRSALSLLEYIGKHYQLFTSKEFLKFFETSYNSVHDSHGNINSIKAQLNIPNDPEFLNYQENEFLSDFDTISIVSSPHSELSDKSATMKIWSDSCSFQDLDNISISTIESSSLLDGSFPDCDTQYIIDASMHVKIAEELESCKKYEEAFLAYKTAIDILLKNVKGEENFDKKRLIKYKSEKYLLRAEKIYNMYLDPALKNFQRIIKKTEDSEILKPTMSDLYKYNVIRILGSGMLVSHSDSHKLYYVKVIHKASRFLEENLILPDNVPYMVRLSNYYNCDNALFLVLEYVNGIPLIDYLNMNKENTKQVLSNDEGFLDNFETSEDDSEKSFSNLVSNYAKQKENKIHSTDSDSKDCTDTSKSNDFSLACSSFNSENLNTTRNFEVNGQYKLEISNADIVKWAAQLILALEKLHILGVTCVNLQSRNLLIDVERDLHLSFMCNIEEICDVFRNPKDLNLAPEVYGIGAVGREVDWWSFGAILYEILVGMDLNYMHPHHLSVANALVVPRYVSPEGRSILRQLLVYEPKDRLGCGSNGIENLKCHPFFRDVNWNQLIEQCQN